MPTTHAGIYYETRGDEHDEPLVLIEGLTAQLIGWHPGFVQMLVERGFHVVLLDNRDVGLSRKYGGPDDLDGGYGIDDMADDVVSVLEALGVSSAHIVGQSMGGMIAQRFAIRYPDRVRSLGLIYTTPHLDAYRRSRSAPVVIPERLERDAAIASFIDRERFSASPGFAFDEAWVTELATRSVDRSYSPDGNARQSAAIRASFTENQCPELSALNIPAVVIHGREDGFFNPEAATALATALPDADLLIFAGMGHEIPGPLFGAFAEAIERTANRAVSVATR